MTIDKKNIFLFDGIGACLSAFTTAGVLPFFSDFLGVPSKILWILSVLPVCYAMYSLGVHFGVTQKKPWMLIAIIIANLTYCIFAAWLLSVEQSLSFWGQAYFFAEALIIIAVACLEIYVLQKWNRDRN